MNNLKGRRIEEGQVPENERSEIKDHGIITGVIYFREIKRCELKAVWWQAHSVTLASYTIAKLLDTLYTLHQLPHVFNLPWIYYRMLQATRLILLKLHTSLRNSFCAITGPWRLSFPLCNEMPVSLDLIMPQRLLDIRKGRMLLIDAELWLFCMSFWVCVCVRARVLSTVHAYLNQHMSYKIIDFHCDITHVYIAFIVLSTIYCLWPSLFALLPDKALHFPR